MCAGLNWQRLLNSLCEKGWNFLLAQQILNFDWCKGKSNLKLKCRDVIGSSTSHVTWFRIMSATRLSMVFIILQPGDYWKEKQRYGENLSKDWYSTVYMVRITRAYRAYRAYTYTETDYTKIDSRKFYTSTYKFHCTSVQKRSIGTCLLLDQFLDHTQYCTLCVQCILLHDWRDWHCSMYFCNAVNRTVALGLQYSCSKVQYTVHCTVCRFCSTVYCTIRTVQYIYTCSRSGVQYSTLQ